MPQTRTYKTGSIIYFEGDKAQYVGILRQGNLQSIHISIESGEETREPVKVGEFFGVKSVLGRYPCEETIQVLSDAVVLAFTPAEFEALAMGNVPIVLKMLKVFSNQLRRVNRKVRVLLSEPVEAANPIAELFKIGEFYYRSRQYTKAIYAYTKFLEYSDSSTLHADDAKKKLAECNSAMGITTPAPAAAPSAPDADSIASAFDAAIALARKGDTQAALDAFLAVVAKSPTADADKSLQERARFEAGKCALALDQWDAAIQSLLAAVKQNPHAAFVKEALVLVGKAYDGKGEFDKAYAYFTKVATLPPADQFSAEAQQLANAAKSKM